MARLLVVEDERKLLRSLQRGLEAEGYEVATAPSGDSAHARLAAETFDAVTSRMVKAAAEGSGRGGELVPVAALAGPAKPSSSGVSIVGALKTRQKEIGFQVLVGAAHKLEPSLQAGAVGAILAFADAAPTACYEIYAAWKEGDFELARLKQERIAKAADRVVGGLSIPGAKYAMDLNGYFGGPVRLPLLPLTADLKTEVEQLMADIKN